MRKGEEEEGRLGGQEGDAKNPSWSKSSFYEGETGLIL